MEDPIIREAHRRIEGRLRRIGGNRWDMRSLKLTKNCSHFMN